MKSLDRRRFLARGASTAAVTSGLLGATTQSSDASEELSSLGKTPHTRFAANVEMWWTDMPFLERVQMAAKFGYPAIEFWPYENKDVDKLAAMTRELKLAIAQFTAWGFTPGMNNPKNEDRFIAKIEQSCAIAKRLNCKKMTVVAGNNQDGMTQQAMLDQVVKALRRAAPIAEEHDVMLILEPMNGRVDHPGHCLYGSPDAIAICKQVDSAHVKINWDLYHMQITEGDLCGRMKEGWPWIGYLQLADHPGRNEPGTGEIHYNRVLKQAWDLGYRGYVGLECRPRTTELAAAQGVKAADIW